MAKFSSPLTHVRVAAPCPADWDAMIGDERVRFCGHCQLNVYNLSGMKKSEAEALITQTEGRLCIRFYRRADGSILTRNCPVGLAALKRRASRLATALASAVMGFLTGIGIQSAATLDAYLPSVERPTTMGNFTTGTLIAPKREAVNVSGPDLPEMGERQVENVPKFELTRKRGRTARLKKSLSR